MLHNRRTDNTLDDAHASAALQSPIATAVARCAERRGTSHQAAAPACQLAGRHQASAGVAMQGPLCLPALVIGEAVTREPIVVSGQTVNTLPARASATAAAGAAAAEAAPSAAALLVALLPALGAAAALAASRRCASCCERSERTRRGACLQASLHSSLGGDCQRSAVTPLAVALLHDALLASASCADARRLSAAARNLRCRSVKDPPAPAAALERLWALQAPPHACLIGWASAGTESALPRLRQSADCVSGSGDRPAGSGRPEVAATASLHVRTLSATAGRPSMGKNGSNGTCFSTKLA